MNYDDLFPNHNLYEQLIREPDRYRDLIAPFESVYQQIENLGVADLLAPSAYSSNAIATAFNTYDGFATAYDKCAGITSALQNLGAVTAPIQSLLDTSWMNVSKPLELQASVLTAIEPFALVGAESALSRLTDIIDGYNDFSIKQHEAIQRELGLANVSDDLQWRLDLVGATSKFVERQLQWTSDYVAENRDQIVDAEFEEIQDEEKYPESIIPSIPQHVAYTKRADVDVSPEDALAQSKITEVTEKGKLIATNIRSINDYCVDAGRDKLFKITDKVFSGGIDISTIVCNGQTNFGVIIDSLYFMFYENLKAIKLLAGGGNETAGDQMVRNDEIYQCIFRVKDMRTDLRHDIEHGKEKDIQKKQGHIADAYQHYCKRRPRKASDYTLLQRNLYDEILALQEHLMELV